MSRARAWLGRFEIGDFAATWRGAVGDSEPHGHFAAQAVIAATPVVVEGANGQAGAQCILIEPNARHRLLPHPDAELHFIEPTFRRHDPQLAEIIGGFTYEIVSENEATGFWRPWLENSEQPARDPRLTDAMRLLDEDLREGPVQLRKLARRAGLSPDRFRHLFSIELGIPLRRYVLWRRMRLAALALGAGSNVTEAAHEAGFADAAHFARTIRDMFGINARQLLKP